MLDMQMIEHSCYHEINEVSNALRLAVKPWRGGQNSNTQARQ
jgi:hypothetical protein